MMKMHRIIFATLVTTVIFVFLTACGDSITSPDDIIFPEKDVSYRNHVKPYLAYNCSFYGCHGMSSGATPAYDYVSLAVQATGWVIPGNPNSSLLIQVLENPYSQHPVTSPPTYIKSLDSTQVAGVRRWIKEGALNN